MKRILSTLALITALAPTSALAQSAQIWACESGFQNTAPGVAANAVGQQFQMAVYDNGFAEGQGFEMGSSGSFQFSFQANWQMNGRNVVIQGTKQGGLAFGQSQFSFQSNFTSETTMAYRHQYANGQVYASQCQRMQ